LKQEVGSPNQLRRRAAETVRPPGTARRAEDPPALNALSAASGQFDTPSETRSPFRRRTSVGLALAAAVVAGTVTMLTGRFEHTCAVTMRFTGDAAHDQLETARGELISHLSGRMADPAGRALAPGAWFTESTAPDHLRFGITAFDREAGVAYARDIATGFQSRIRDAAAQARDTPGVDERILSELADGLRARLSESRTQVKHATEKLPEHDPPEEHTALLTHWRTLRADFELKREQFSAASVEVANLLAEPDPTHGLVSADRRREVLENDPALQQDLRELEVNLTELKLHLLNAWQTSSGALERLILATGDLIETTSAVQGNGGADDVLATVGDLARAAEDYRSLLTGFSEAWNREFTAVQRLKVDPYRGEMLNVYDRVRRLLNDFLFQASKRLSAMRSQLRRLDQGPSDSARHHVLQSNLMRAFQAVQGAHHGFEFAAAALETPDNFRMDAALKTARGLRRRSQARVRDTERRLQAEAAKRASRQHAERLAEARRTAQSLRDLADSAMSELLAVQDALNTSSTQKEAFLQGMLEVHVATTREQLLEDDLARFENLIERLAAERTSAVRSADIEIVSCGVTGPPVNIIGQIRVAGAIAAATLATVLVGQCWITRRSRRSGRPPFAH